VRPEGCTTKHSGYSYRLNLKTKHQHLEYSNAGISIALTDTHRPTLTTPAPYSRNNFQYLLNTYSHPVAKALNTWAETITFLTRTGPRSLDFYASEHRWQIIFLELKHLVSKRFACFGFNFLTCTFDAPGLCESELSRWSTVTKTRATICGYSVETQVVSKLWSIFFRIA